MFEYLKLASNDKLCCSFDNLHEMQKVKNDLGRAGKAIITDGKCGILLYGSGTGKSFIAKCFAGYLAKVVINKPVIFMPASIADMSSCWPGQTAEKLCQVFEKAAEEARQNGACVLFLEQVEAILFNPDSSRQQTEDERKSVNTLLNLIGRYSNFCRFKIVIVMATNFLESLDVAAIRAGRVDFKIEIKSPDHLAD